jgi:hypothetical protein
VKGVRRKKRERGLQMTHRFLVAAGALTLTSAVVVWLAAAPVAGQAPSTAAKTNGTAAKIYTPPRTPDGQPDLQGFWTNSAYTPLERPNGVTKEFYTPQEAAAAEKAAAERESEQTEPGTVADVHYDFTQFGLDRSQSAFAHNLRTSQIIDPPDGKLPPVTAEGQKRAADRAAARRAMGAVYDRVENMPINARCLVMAGSGPPMQNTGYNNNYQIVQSPGYVMILVEMIHDARIIPLDGREQPSRNIRQWMGVSRGRWEGNTLVVETTNMNGKNPFRGASENMRVTERFTRVADDAIMYRFTVEDEATWARPWTAEMPMQKTVGPLFEHACHEGNYAVANTLAGVRLADKKAAEAAAGGEKKIAK